jgi:glycosyltransferase involved in cell wall biosynthesis
MSDRPTTLVVEVTDTLAAPFTTGIQRVVREVAAGLASRPELGIEVVPVVTPAPGAGFRRLTDAESERLRHHPAGGRAGRRADDFGRLSPLVRRLGDLPLVVSARARVSGWSPRRRQLHPAHPELAWRPPHGAVFLDLEGSWYAPTPRAQLLPALRRDGVQPMVFLHDVMPLVQPQWFTPRHRAVFTAWLDAHLTHSESVLANSRCTAADAARVAAERGLHVEPTVIPLGADPPVEHPRPVELPPEIEQLLLVVGTLEPRKDQVVVLDAFDRLRAEHPGLGLALVGKEGWMVDELVERIRTHPEQGRRLLWLGGIDDAQLAWLYDRAHLSVAPSRYEGLGVPVMESLAHGCATIASRGGAQPEAADGAAELFEPGDVDELTALVRRHLSDPAHHDEWVRRAQTHPTPTWAGTTSAIAEAVHRLVAGR